MKQKYYALAEKELEKRRAENDALQERNIEAAEKKIPELSQLRAELSAQGIAIAKLVISGESDVKNTIDALAQENLLLQDKIEKLLIANGFAADFLDRIYTCGICKDTGIDKNKICSCKHALARKIECDELNSASTIPMSSFESFNLSFYDDIPGEKGMSPYKIMTKNYDFCKKYAENFHIPYESVLMRGKTGLGKTHLSLAIANEVMKNGYSVIYGSAPELFRKMEQEHFNSSSDSQTLELLESADLIIIDDLGAEFESKFYSAKLYELVNYRLGCGKPMIFNTNLEISEIQQRYGERTASRLLTMEMLTFLGSDIRIKKKYAKG